MSKKTVFHYARLAAQAEQRILEMLDSALRDRPADERSAADLRKSARPRQGQDSSG
jgi:hypothetical protein